MSGGRKTKGGPDSRVGLAPFNPIGSHQQNAALTVATTLTPPITEHPATMLMVQAFDQSIRFTLDGAAPTPTFGFRITNARDAIIIPIGPATVLRFVEEAATATLQYIWGQ